MGYRRLWILTLLLALPLFACQPGSIKTSESLPVVNKVHQGVAAYYCAQCHIQKGEQYQPKTFDSIKACQDCHPPLGHNHSVNTTPKESVADLPLYDGKIACLTCHDPHNSRGYGSLLRQEPRVLCNRCHQK